MAELHSFPTAPGWEWLFNQQGRLTPEQIKRVRKAETTRRIFAISPVYAIWLYSSSLEALEQSFGRNLPAVVHGAAIGAIAAMWIEMCLALVVIIRTTVGMFRIRFESGEGRVAQVEGILRWCGRRLIAEAGSRRLTISGEIGMSLLPGQYRFYYLPKSRVVAAAEWIGDPVPYAKVTTRKLPAASFPASALPFNREGRRSPDQGSMRVPLTLLLITGLFFIVLFAPLFTRGSLDIYFYMAQPLVFALYWFAYSDFRRFTGFTDMRPGQVASVEGVVRRTEGENEKGNWVYSYVVNGHTFRVSKVAYDALDDRYVYRLYYTAWGNHLLNMEPVGEVAGTRQGAP